jgi:hypothetical protein
VIVTPPPSWTVEPNPDGVVETYASPKAADGARVLLYATRATVSDARGAVDDLHDVARRAGMSGTIAIDSWAERADADAKLVEATLVYRDTSARTLDTRRVVIARDGTHAVAVTGECFSRDDADPKLLDACRAALATLDVGIAPGKRVAIALGAASTPPSPDKPKPTFAPKDEAPPVPQRPSAGSGEDDLEREPPSMSDGSRTPMPPIVVAPGDSSTDKRPIFVGAAVLTLGAGLWWNRRRRLQIEREDAEGSSGDDDADELHAAAKDDDAKPNRVGQARPSEVDEKKKEKES